MKTVLLLCTGNSCRSQMAEAVLRYELGGQVRPLSAGTRPEARVSEGALQALRRAGIPAGGLHPKHVDVWREEAIDLVVTLCDGASASCPVLPGPAPRIHLPFHDPYGEPLEAFERVLADIRARLVPLVRETLALEAA